MCVDCCIEEQGELTIIDYKTDYVNDKTVEERAKLYEGQLKTYAEAMNRITKKHVRQAILYFLHTGQANRGAGVVPHPAYWLFRYYPMF